MIYIGWLVFSVVVGFLAESRGRTGPGFFLLSLLLSPLIGLVVLLLVRNLREEARQEAMRAEDRKFQLEAIQAAARQNATSSTPAVKPEALADHLAKLAELRAHGAIPEDEYKRQVSQALGQ